MRMIAIRTSLLLAGIMLSGAASAELCGGPLDANNFSRPVDYTDTARDANNVNLVERYHFSSKVEGLVAGDTAPLPMDIDYVLRQVPNHYRALSAMAKWQLRNARPPTAAYQTVDCYFERAFSFRPEDGNLYLLYAIYLHQKKDFSHALENYKRAETLQGGGAELYYNVGLLYFDTGDYSQARAYAQKAYELGYPLPGLRNKLVRAGEWSDSQARPQSAPPPASPQPEK